MMRKLLRSAAALSALALGTTTAQAQVFNTAAPLVGSISAPNTTAGGTYTNLSVSWNITQEGDLLRYTYTFSGFTGNGISHAILSLSPNCADNNQWATCASAFTVNGQNATDVSYGTFGPGPSNPGIGGDLFGVKVNTPGSVDGVSPFVVSFLSTRAPVYGDFYVKGGSDNYAYNDGLVDHASNNTAIFIARPDTFGGGTGNVVPEPSTYVLLGSGLLGLAGIARRRRNV